MHHRVHYLQVVTLAILLLAPLPARADEPQVSPYLVLNRCKGTCLIHGGIDDAKAMSSSIPCPGGADCSGGGCRCNSNPAGDYVIEEFKSSTGQIGAAADAEWADLVKCVREVYSPYAIQVVEQIPPGAVSYNLAIVAGKGSNISYSGILGISPPTGCGPRDNVITFSLANMIGGSGLARTWNICALVAQETAHAYGLDHAYEFSDGRPACSDPMTYRPSCGQQFFRNDNTTCGEYAKRPCSCGGFQNSHKRLVAVFGAGTPITPPPKLAVTQPAPNATIANAAVVAATASAQRGIARIDLWLNGYKWTTVKGAPFGNGGQPESSYSLVIPSGVPDSIIDIVVKAYDDIDSETVAPTITVTKGAPCSSASTCAEGQACADGRCFWPEPVGEVGDACDYPQYCISGQCIATTDGDVCSEQCVVGVEDSCPETFYCEGTAGETGFCLSETVASGCCSVGGDRRGAMVLALGVLGLLLRPRRRRRT